MIEQTLSTVLSTAPAITAICGTRIYPLVLPGDPTLPAITYQIIASVTTPSLATSTGLTRTRMQFDAFASSYGDAATLRQAILNTLLDAQIAGIQNITHLSSSDLFDHEALQYIARIELYIYH